MKITLPNQLVTVSNPVTLELGDTGTAHVRAALLIDNNVAIEINEPKSGSTTRNIGNLPQGTYDAALVVSATNVGLGPKYDTTLKVGGKVVASAKGALTAFTESDFINFTIKV